MPTPADRPRSTAVRRSRTARRAGRTLAVLGVAAVLAVPATDAVAAGRARADRHRHHPVVTSTTSSSSSGTSSSTTTSAVPLPQGWTWGPALFGEITMPGGVTVTFQQGVVKSVDATHLVVTSGGTTDKSWTLTPGTRIVVGGRGGHDDHRRHARATDTAATTATTDTTTSGTTSSTTSGTTSSSTTTSSTTSSSTTTSSTTSGPGGLTVGQRVQVWGTGWTAATVRAGSAVRND